MKNTTCTLPKHCLFFILMLMVFSGQAQHLQVSANKRFLVKADGSPFFYLGDTAWELFHRLNREEADLYLQDRAAKGFTVIQAVVLAELNGLRDPNPYGHLPLHSQDPAKPNEAYFGHVDYIVSKAEKLGLTVGMLPTWGDKVFLESWGVGPVVFNPKNAQVYGAYLGRRYKDKPIIWILGGDRNPTNKTDEEIWRAMAAGITMGAGGGNPTKVLISYHPKGGSGSSQWFHQDDWLDFNMFQSGHCRNLKVYDNITHDYNRTPVKPAMDAEPVYEDHPLCQHENQTGYSEAYDVRRSAYLTLFAGAHGHTYGCHAVWQMYTPERQPVNGPRRPWQEALNLPGAQQMRHVRTLLESRPMLERVPDQSLLQEAYAAGDRIQATRGKSYAFVYTTSGKPFSLRMGKISGEQVQASWYNPRTGETTGIGRFQNTGSRTFTPPTNGTGNDWVLILDDVDKRYKAPAAKR